MKQQCLKAFLAIGLGFGFPTLSFAESRWMSLRFDLLGIPWMLSGPLGGPTYFMSYLMLEDMGGWSFGLMGRYASFLRTINDEEETLQYGLGFRESYKQVEYGIRVERKLPIFNATPYIATEVYRSRMNFDYAQTYEKGDQTCFWLESGNSSFDAGTFLVGNEWRTLTRLSIWTELGYKVARDTTKTGDSTVYNPCGEAQDRPKPDNHSWYELPKSKWFIAVNFGFNF